MYLNILIVWTLTGMWHGASWNYMLWGLYFALLMFAEKAFLLKLYDLVPSVFRYTITLVLVVFGWSLFYFEDLSKFGEFCVALVNFAPNESVSFLFDLKQNIFWFGLVIMFCIPWNEFGFVNQRLTSLSVHPVILSSKIVLHIGVLLICTSFLVGSTYNPFLYFRF